MITPSLLFVFNSRQDRIKLAPLISEAKKRMLPVYTCFTGKRTLQAVLNRNEISFLVVKGHTKAAIEAVMVATKSGIDVAHIADESPTARQNESDQRVINQLSRWHFVENTSPNSTAYAAKTIIDTLANQTFLKFC